MPPSFVKRHDVRYLDTLFDWPRVQPLPADQLRRIPQEHLSLWCLQHGLYQLPSVELIDFLGEHIGSANRALEIGAGAGHIGRHVGIPMVDNKMQDWPEIRSFYQSLNQPTVSYGADVLTEDANAAVERLQPQVVLGCWVTERSKVGHPGGNMYGPDEQALLAHPALDCYLMVGNRRVHDGKLIRNECRHEVLQPDWLFSRSLDRASNVIYLFYPRSDDFGLKTLVPGL
jgi:hypothetical protein